MRKFTLLFLFVFSWITLFSQEENKKVTLLWDTSYSMIHKNLKFEFQYLSIYFRQNKNVDLNLIKFSNDVILDESYSIKNGDWRLLKNELTNTIYDGSSSYTILKEKEADEILMFTDGNESLDKLPLYFPQPTLIIATSPKSNVEGLNKLASNSKGKLIDLSKKATLQKVAPIKVTGNVKDLTGPLSNVKVYSRETKKEAFTNDSGDYTIDAIKGGVLEFRAEGKNTLYVSVPSSGLKDVLLSDGSEVLDEVVVASNKKEVEEEEDSKVMSKKNVGYAVQKIDSKDISVQDLTVENAIAGRFSNVELKADQKITEFLARGRNMTMLLDQTGLVVVDGVPVESSPSSTIGMTGDKNVLSSLSLDPQNIEDIKVLKGLAATNKYGTLGRNGVIEITTKGASSNKRRNKSKPLGTTSTYSGDALEKSITEKPFIKELQKAKTIDEAYNIYLKQRVTLGNNAAYFFDVVSYFKNWGNPYMIKRVLSNVLELEESNQVNALMALAYKYEELGLHKEACSVYEKVIAKEPSMSQAYRNLALAYQNANEFSKAQELYNKIDKNEISEVKSLRGVKKAAIAEYKNMVFFHKNRLNQSLIPDFYKNNITYRTRIVFEWSHFDAEFDVQIVNPQNRFFTWSHTKKAEAARMSQEQQNGYGTEEFFITSSDKGKWLFNLTYFGKLNKSDSSPTYLKVTTYHYYGKSNQTKKVQLLTLKDLNKKESILKLSI